MCFSIFKNPAAMSEDDSQPKIKLRQTVEGVTRSVQRPSPSWVTDVDPLLILMVEGVEFKEPVHYKIFTSFQTLIGLLCIYNHHQGYSLLLEFCEWSARFIS